MSSTIITSATNPFRSGIVWKFETARFRVELRVSQDFEYEYDGDDEDGSTQDMLDSGEYVAFNSAVRVYLDGQEIASDHLGGSVYSFADASDFWTAHRSSDPMDRNCSIMRAARGNCVICHYFPDMVTAAIAMAREELANRPALPVMRQRTA